ncbi:MAG: hypothetical protein LBI87_05010 [Candidatus Accumulibacter sp.]|jgi:hypothetical protein|nr:hypothetical protein [Accumulibacter sp.]
MSKPTDSHKVPIDIIFLQKLYEAIFGKAIASLLADMTGISVRTWQDGGPKRKSVLAKIEDKSQQAGLKAGFSHDEIDACRDSPFSVLVINFCSSKDFQHTLKVAKKLDDRMKRFYPFHENRDVEGFKGAFIEDGILAELEEWLSAVEEEKYLASIRKAVREAKSWDELQPAIVWELFLAYFQLMACWDIEFFSTIKWDLEPQPIGDLVMPALNPKAKKRTDGNYPSRGLLHFPMRRLLDLCYCLSIQRRKGKWPHKRGTRRQVAMACGEVLMGKSGEASEQPLANIRNGARKLNDKEFLKVWNSMMGNNKNKIEIFTPPWPWYIFAQIMTLMFVKFVKSDKSVKSAKSVIIFDPPVYRYWWDRYYDELKGQGACFGCAPWPECLRPNQPLLGVKSPDSDRSSQSSGRPSSPRDSQ